VGAQGLHLGTLPLCTGFVSAAIVTEARAKLTAGIGSALQGMLDGVAGVAVDRLFVVLALHRQNPS